MREDKVIVEIKDLKVGVFGTGAEKLFSINYGSFDVCAGDFVIIKGKNGCGKSTLFRLLYQLDTGYFKIEGRDGAAKIKCAGLPDKSVDGYRTDELSLLSRKVVFVGQEDKFETFASAYSAMYNTVKSAVQGDKELTAAQKKQTYAKIDTLIADYYEKYLKRSFKCKSYSEFRNKRITSWSGGQQKMLHVLAGIVKAEVCGLELILLDEPLNNLDGQNKDILNKIFSGLKSKNIAIMIITHCQVFDGINKVLEMEQDENGLVKAKMIELNEDYPAHHECLEAYNN